MGSSRCLGGPAHLLLHFFPVAPRPRHPVLKERGMKTTPTLLGQPLSCHLVPSSCRVIFLNPTPDKAQNPLVSLSQFIESSLNSSTILCLAFTPRMSLPLCTVWYSSAGTKPLYAATVLFPLQGMPFPLLLFLVKSYVFLRSELDVVAATKPSLHFLLI